jgi:glyoxylase-like metal-dependent hydrolase (beta-lactamase superfamily II)
MKTLRIALLTAALFAGVTPVAHAAENTKVNSVDIVVRGLTPADFPRQKMLVPNVYLYEGLHTPDADGRIINTVSMYVVTPDGVAVVDAQGDLAQTQGEIDAIKKVTSQPIKYVIIGSDHGDHTGGNAAFKAAFPDVVFISSPASQKVLAKTATPPTQTVSDHRVLTMGGTEIDILNLGRAHTGGDMMVYLPQGKVLFMSEVYLRGMFPSMRTAYPSEWVKTIEKAQALPNVTWYIPAHGFTDDAPTMKHDLEEARKALVAVIAEAKRLHDAHVPCEPPARGTKAPPCEAVLKANWGEYAKLGVAHSHYEPAILNVYRELDGKLP